MFALASEQKKSARVTLFGRNGSEAEFDGGGSGVAVTILPEASGSTVIGIVISNYDQGILIMDASDCKIYENTIYSNNIAINPTESSTSNTIHSNTISSNDVGLDLAESSGNTIYVNTLSGNDVGINISHSSDNTIYHNNFVENTQQVTTSNPSSNVWDDGYPSGGNYWSDYTGIDANGDGIGDTPYVIDADNVDRYPLMEPWPCEITPQFTVGGIYIPANRLSLLAPYIGLTILLAVAVIAVGYVKKRKQR